MLSVKVKVHIFNRNYIYPHRQISYNIKILCWNNVVEIFTLDREPNGPRATSLLTTAMMKSLLWGQI